MAIVLYELAGRDKGRPFSPHCWKVAFALRHKGLDYKTVPVLFTEIPTVGEGSFSTVPVIRDGKIWLADSFQIALYLDRTYPDRPSLFSGTGGETLARFIEKWVQTVISGFVGRALLLDIHAMLDGSDQVYFRTSREKRFGQTLEEVVKGREERLAGFRASLTPMRSLLAEQPFLGGQGPLFADYIMAGVFQWARIVSTYGLLAKDDPVAAWFERCLDLHEGFARRVPAAS